MKRINKVFGSRWAFLVLTLYLLMVTIDQLHDEGYSELNLAFLIAASAIVFMTIVEIVIVIVKAEWPS